MNGILSKKLGFNYSLHGLRGIAALMVYIGHSANGFREHICNNCSNEPLLKHLFFLGSTGVEIFFFLSGYVIFSASLKADIRKFASHRFWRIYPIFIFFTVLYFILNHFVQKAPDRNSIFYFISNISFLNLFLGTTPLSPNIWTITYEVWFYIMTFGVLRPVVLKRHYFISVIAVAMWSYFIWRHPITLYYLMGVLTNILHRRYTTFLPKLNTKIGSTVQYSTLCIFVWAAFRSDYRYHWEYMANFNLWLLMVTLTIFMITLLNESTLIARLLKSNFFLFLGTISYSLYLTHPYSYLIARMTTQQFLNSGVSFLFATLIYVTLNIFLTTVFVFFIFKFIENGIYKFGTGKEIYSP